MHLQLPRRRRRATTLHSPLPHQQHILTHSPPCSLQQGKRRPWPCAVCCRPAPHHHHRDQETDNCTARPTAALQPFRLANAAFISSSSAKPAAPVTQKPGLVSGAPGTPPPMKAITGKPHREVPLPSQEGKKGVMQYALYVGEHWVHLGKRTNQLTCPSAPPSTKSQTGRARALCGP
jgi:hypothetical protein